VSIRSGSWRHNAASIARSALSPAPCFPRTRSTLIALAAVAWISQNGKVSGSSLPAGRSLRQYFAPINGDAIIASLILPAFATARRCLSSALVRGSNQPEQTSRGALPKEIQNRLRVAEATIHQVPPRGPRRVEAHPGPCPRVEMGQNPKKTVQPGCWSQIAGSFQWAKKKTTRVHGTIQRPVCMPTFASRRDDPDQRSTARRHCLSARSGSLLQTHPHRTRRPAGAGISIRPFARSQRRFRHHCKVNAPGLHLRFHTESSRESVRSQLLRSVRFRGRNRAASTPGTRYSLLLPMFPLCHGPPLPFGSFFRKTLRIIAFSPIHREKPASPDAR